MTPDQHNEAAARLLTAEETGQQCGLLSLAYPGMTLEDAYAVQKALVTQKLAKGRKKIGWKIGLTSRAMQQALNITPPTAAFSWMTWPLRQAALCPPGASSSPVSRPRSPL